MAGTGVAGPATALAMASFCLALYATTTSESVSEKSTALICRNLRCSLDSWSAWTTALPVAVLEAVMMLWTSQIRTSAWMSLSCGWADRGSRKKKTAATWPCEMSAPISWSPPSGPDYTLQATSSPSFSSRALPVLPVVMIWRSRKNSRCFATNRIIVGFMSLCATSDTYRSTRSTPSASGMLASRSAGL